MRRLGRQDSMFSYMGLLHSVWTGHAESRAQNTSSASMFQIQPPDSAGSSLTSCSTLKHPPLYHRSFVTPSTRFTTIRLESIMRIKTYDILRLQALRHHAVKILETDEDERRIIISAFKVGHLA